jgi:NADPH:quinone reductase-like Zn-dependent oxidoreductase
MPFSMPFALGVASMRAFEIQNGFGLENVKLAERPTPQPGPGEVLLKMRAFSLNYRDLLVAKGVYNPKLKMPFVPLSDGVGVVAAVGEGVSRVKVGDRVATMFMQRWLSGTLTEAGARSALGGGIPGVAAEYVVLHQDGVSHIAEHLTDEEAATLPCAALTAWNALITQGRLSAGETILIQGTGGVSLFALQFARMHEVKVIATSGSADKLERVQRLGAVAGINYKTTPEWGDKVRELTGGAGVDHVVEVGGAGTLPQSLKAVRYGGRISLIGVLSGGSQFNPIMALMKHICIQGIFVGSREMFEAMNVAIARHRLRPVIDRVFPFEQLPEALRYLESGAHFGKVCLKV